LHLSFDVNPLFQSLFFPNLTFVTKQNSSSIFAQIKQAVPQRICIQFDSNADQQNKWKNKKIL
jgi:hypothetical protein